MSGRLLPPSPNVSIAAALQAAAAKEEAMKRYRLLRISGKEAVKYPTGEWQLWPTTPEAYECAIAKLHVGWTDGIQACSDKRDVFIFTNGNAKLPLVLESLRKGGIPQDEMTFE